MLKFRQDVVSGSRIWKRVEEKELGGRGNVEKGFCFKFCFVMIRRENERGSGVEVLRAAC